jgi:hypothetical protein
VCIDNVNTRLVITLYGSLTHTDYCPQSIIVSTSRFLATDFNTGTITVSLNYTPIRPSFTAALLQLTLYFTASRTELHWTDSSGTRLPILKQVCPLLMIFRHGPHTKFRSSIVAFVSVAAGTCLPSRCPETVAVRNTQKTHLFYCCVRVCCGLYLATTAVYIVTA